MFAKCVAVGLGGFTLSHLEIVKQSLVSAKRQPSCLLSYTRVDKKPDALYPLCFSGVSLTLPGNLFLNCDLHQSRLMDYPCSVRQLGRTKPRSTALPFFSTNKC